ncbi:MAG: transglutaminase family protein [Clostridiales bacterium]|nr:transglutaminase family protein [Clostridiales bacterium]
MAKTLCYAYELSLRFSLPAHDHSYLLRLSPPSNEGQQVLEQRLRLSPPHEGWEIADAFGNRCLCGHIFQSHLQFQAVASGAVRTGLSDGVAEPDPMRWGMMKSPSPYTRPGPNLLALSRRLAAPCDCAPLERAWVLARAVHDVLTYCPRVTDTHTTAEEALTLGEGVCQDYAHILLALCRLENIPARYTAGMLVGEGASHAWVEVLSQGRWYGLDPTNLLPVREQHIVLAWGRDGGDCPLNRGSFLGGGDQTQTVRVSVHPVTAP